MDLVSDRRGGSVPVPSVLAATTRPPHESRHEPSLPSLPPTRSEFRSAPSRPAMAIRAGRSVLHLLTLAFLLILAASPCLQGNAARDPAPSLPRPLPPRVRGFCRSARVSRMPTAAALDLCDFSRPLPGNAADRAALGCTGADWDFGGRVCVDSLV